MVKKKFNVRDERKIQLDKKTGVLSNLEVPKITALYYYQFIKKKLIFLIFIVLETRIKLDVGSIYTICG